MVSGQGLAIFVIAMNCIFITIAKAMAHTPNEKELTTLLDQNIIDEIVEGAVDSEIFTTIVFNEDDKGYLLEDLAYQEKLPYMRKTWKRYLKEWLEDNEELIKLALKEYDYHERGAYGLGIDVGYNILDRDLSFDDRHFLDVELVDRLEDSLDGYWCPDGMHEVWLENSELRISRWGLD